MKIVLLTNGNVVLTDDSDNVLKKFDPTAFVESTSSDSINIYSSNKLTAIKLADISATRIDPNADVPFGGDIDVLMDQLTSEFFSYVPSAELLSNWNAVPGNSKEFTYYSGVVAGNPSGNKNVETALYKTGVTTVLTQTFAYDIDDDVISITTS